MIFYELFVRSFYDSNNDGIGDLKGITMKLDYLKDLGVEGIWLLPIMQSAAFHGYTVIDFYSINPSYGTIDDFKELTKEAHKKGMKIVLDVPINHTSVKCEWFQKAINGNEKYKNYYVWANEKTDLNEKRHWDDSLIWFKYKDKYFYGLFGSSSPDLNFENKELWKEIKNVFKFWIELGVDGFRLDAAKHIFDYDIKNMKFKYQHEKNIEFWKEMTGYIKSLKSDAIIISEIWDSPEIVKKYHGLFDVEFNFPLSYYIKDTIKYHDPKILVNGIEETLKHYINGHVESISGNFFTNHDMERLTSEFNGNSDMSKMSFNILFTLPGYPFIYYGEELGMLGEIIDVNFTEDSQEPMQWYESGFGPGQTEWKGCKYNPPYSKLSVEEQEKNQNSVLNHVKSLIKFRKENRWIENSKIVDLKNDRFIVTYTLKSEYKELKVYHNIKSQKTTIKLEKNKSYKIFGNAKITGNIAQLYGYATLILEK
ncbi:Glycosidase [Marinitoga hydrogenitolerans DSM 16785]|uniref:Alpha-amylase n=1 Tax=Marinitoga hydrogenitolerans (strain DSM 16785 / JCM 12826 / AT1271) TaxID=1122195 RepID=A0A1M4WCW2_MARH1|nr:alpha-amylase family glycosyl hydrolase [Marinitoga hydrogenitolerans]SHE79098.1 Glycosidase [Marinitoga hydrogenitolerans DSM 16785]